MRIIGSCKPREKLQLIKSERALAIQEYLPGTWTLEKLSKRSLNKRKQQ